MKKVKASGIYNCWKLGKRLIRDSQYSDSKTMLISAGLAEYYLSKGNHFKVREIANFLINRNLLLGHYYTALSYFLFADYGKAEHEVLSIPDYHQIAEVVFLYTEILIRINRCNEAWCLLESLVKFTTRKKSWLLMSNLVENGKDCERFLRNIAEVECQTSLLDNDDLITAKINAYMRCGQTIEALEIVKSPTWKGVKGIKLVKNIDTKQANVALQDLKTILDQKGVEFFLISGTLLGCIRENNFLGHDKDIDVGVWDTYTYEQLIQKIATSGNFYIIKSRTRDVIKLRHLNGTNVDVFITYREFDDYWHAGVKQKWHNKPFELVEHYFLGASYLIPADFDLYLTENYGDWQTPMKNFDSAYDTPNSVILNKDEFKLYEYTTLNSNL
ncbi:hypothetical protein VH441_06230 [Psychrobacter sp. HD31]|uniref:hypothetical protein n=1 Tax=Psychrobacter sp. HD31 TaxID=3112003 RepID=UPI003DA430EB